MTTLTGLFSRGSSFYLRVVLPHGHPSAQHYRSGRVVLSLGVCARREAISKGIMLRADILRGKTPPGRKDAVDGLTIQASTPSATSTPFRASKAAPPPCPTRPVHLRDVFDQWVKARPRSADTIAACGRALALYEAQTGNPALQDLSRAAGVAFRAWLQQPERATTAKTARDRLTWVKSLLKHAQVELELLSRSPWQGLDIEHRTTHRRRPWSDSELQHFFGAPLHTEHRLPTDTKAGGEAAYWLPLLGLYSGARISELVQLRRRDINLVGEILVMSVTDQGEGQKVKTAASNRLVPLHAELLRLGLMDYIARIAPDADDRLWPGVPLREGKSGGFFSQWFGQYRRRLGFGRYPDFHCLRHSMRSALANADVAEPMIDTLLGHEIRGSTGARVYTHRTIMQMKAAIEKVHYPHLGLVRVSPAS